MPKSYLEEMLEDQIKEAGLPAAMREMQFHPIRKWRWDFAWPEFMLAIEIQGGIYSRGRHSRGIGMEKDMEKWNAGTSLGWHIYKYSPRKIKNGEAIAEIKSIIEGISATTNIE